MPVPVPLSLAAPATPRRPGSPPQPRPRAAPAHHPRSHVAPLAPPLPRLHAGPTAPLFTDTFVELCTAALMAVREHAETLLGLAEITNLAPSLPCFAGAGRAPIEALRHRLLLHVSDGELRERVRELILLSYDHMNTRLYDRFQKLSNNIEP